MKLQKALFTLILVVALAWGGPAFPLATPRNAVLADTPPPPLEALQAALSAPAPPPPAPEPEATELRAGLEALELALQQGPEAVLALHETLRGAALDLAMDDIVAARQTLRRQAPPPWSAPTRPEAPPVTEAEELAAIQAQEALAAAERAYALAQHDALANNLDATASAPPPQPDAAPHIQADRTVGTPPCTYATIAAAITAANPGDRLLLEGGVTFAENLSLNESLTLQGGYTGCGSGSSAQTTIDGSGAGRVMYIHSGLDITLLNLKIMHGNTTGNGAGIFVSSGSHVRGTNLDISANTSSVLGGGVRLWGGSATFTNTNIFDNSAVSGAGVYAEFYNGYAPALNLNSSVDIYDNSALTGDGFGGGVYMREGTISLLDSSDIRSNDAIHGGGVYLITGTLTIQGATCEIDLNTATSNGGGIYAQDSAINLDLDAELVSNTAGLDGGGNGGGAYLNNSNLMADKARVYYNSTDDYGGGIYAINGSLVDMDLGGYPCTGPWCSQLSYNDAGLYGGGVYASTSEVDLQQTFVENNTGSFGGAIYASRDPSSGSAVYAYNVLFARNSGGDADGIRLFSGTGNTTRMVSSHVTLAYNPSTGDGTAIGFGSTGALTLTLSNAIVWGHTTSINDPDQPVTCSDIQGGYTGANNLNVDPLFVNPGAANFHLQSFSPVIDRCATGQSRDFDNEQRPVTYIRPSTPYDMGADEASARVGLNGVGCVYGRIQDAVDAAASGDTIQAAADTFTETVDIAGKNLVIVGGYGSDCVTSGAGVTTINGNGAGSVVDITGAAVTLRNLALTNGDATTGGGIDTASNARVTLDNTGVFGNSAGNGGGLFVNSGCVLTITNDSDIHHNTASSAGGGARVWGKLVGDDWNSTIEHNTALNGGGVSVPGGVLSFSGSHVVNNQATGAQGVGGGVHVYDEGEASFTASSNVYRNSAYNGAGIYADHSQVTLVAVIHSNTAANDGGGIYLMNGSTLSAINTIVGDDLAGRDNEAIAGAGGGIYARNSTIDFRGEIYNNLAATRGGGVLAESSVVTLTHTTVGNTGANQPNQVTADLFGAGLFFSNTHALLSDTVVSSNAFTSGAGWGTGITAWGGSVITLTQESRVERHHAPAATIFGGSGAGLLIFNSTVTLHNSQILSNTAAMGGGGIYMVQASTLNVLNNSVLRNNSASNGHGGAIYAINAPDINVRNSTFSDNSASGDGGAIQLDAGTLDFTGGWTLRENTAGGNGGAVAVAVGSAARANFNASAGSLAALNQATGGHGGMLYLGNGTTAELHAPSGAELTIYGNRAGGNGGALYADNGGFFDVYGQVSFDSNRADNGGALYLSNGSGVWLDDLNDTKPKLWDNFADSGDGGALYALDSPRVECDGAVFGRLAEGNHASASGGAIYLSNSTLNADNCAFLGNRAATDGGAIAAHNATVVIYATYPSPARAAAEPETFKREVAASSAILAEICDPLTRECSAFTHNVADSDGDTIGYGGAIYSHGSDLEVNHSYFHHNAARRGGAIFQIDPAAVADIYNSLIYSNTVSTSLGAGIRTESGTFRLTHVTLANNVGGAGFSGVASSATNSIAWGNSVGGFSQAPTYAACNIDQSGVAGLALDPLFQNPGGGENYHLRGLSPAIDACATGLSPDLDNLARPWGSGYDMGAYEAALGVSLGPDRTSSGASPGTVVYGHTLTNTGSLPDTYTLNAVSSHGWSAAIVPATPVTLNGGQSTPVNVTLSIPSGVVSGTLDTLVITAVAASDPGLTASATDTTRVYVPQYTLTVNTTGSGTVDRDPDLPTYPAGAIVTLTADPAEGWRFDHWTGAASGSALTTTVTMDGDKTVGAIFTEQVDYLIYLPLVLRQSP